MARLVFRLGINGYFWKGRVYRGDGSDLFM